MLMLIGDRRLLVRPASHLLDDHGAPLNLGQRYICRTKGTKEGTKESKATDAYIIIWRAQYTHGLYTRPAAMTSPPFPIDLLQADLSAIVTALDSGLFTSEQLVQEYQGQYSVLLLRCL